MKEVHLLWMSWGCWDETGETVLAAYKDRGLAEAVAAACTKQWPTFKDAWYKVSNTRDAGRKRAMLREDYPMFFREGMYIIPDSLEDVDFDVTSVQLIGE